MEFHLSSARVHTGSRCWARKHGCDGGEAAAPPVADYAPSPSACPGVELSLIMRYNICSNLRIHSSLRCSHADNPLFLDANPPEQEASTPQAWSQHRPSSPFSNGVSLFRSSRDAFALLALAYIMHGHMLTMLLAMVIRRETFRSSQQRRWSP